MLLFHFNVFIVVLAFRFSYWGIFFLHKIKYENHRSFYTDAIAEERKKSCDFLGGFNISQCNWIVVEIKTGMKMKRKSSKLNSFAYYYVLLAFLFVVISLVVSTFFFALSMICLLIDKTGWMRAIPTHFYYCSVTQWTCVVKRFTFALDKNGTGVTGKTPRQKKRT